MAVKTIYLVPTGHTYEHDAEDVKGRLGQVKAIASRFLIAIEFQRTYDSIEIFRKLRHKTDSEIHDFAKDSDAAIFLEPMLKALREFNKLGIKILPIAIGKTDSEFQKSKDFRYYMHKCRDCYSKVKTIQEAIPYLRIAFLLRKPYFAATEAAVTRKLKDIITGVDLPIVAIIGRLHTSNLETTFKSLADIHILQETPNPTRDFTLEANGILDDVAKKKIPELTEADKLAYARYMLYEGLVNIQRGTISSEDISAIKDIKSMDEAEEIFSLLRQAQ